MTVEKDLPIANIPIIDLSPLHSPYASPSAISQIATQIRSACIDSGFFQIVNHGIPPTLQTAVFRNLKKVFDLSIEDKLSLKRDPFGNRGYEILEGQSLDGAVEGQHKKVVSEYGGNDLKEGYYIGKERKEGDPMLQRRFNGLNKWPDIPEFKAVMIAYYEVMKDLAIQIMELIALYITSCLYTKFRSLGLEKDYFMKSGFCEDGVAALRLLHYPPQREVGPTRIGSGAHTGLHLTFCN
jgi:isopenicillin N synthase-like dioxygenase